MRVDLRVKHDIEAREAAIGLFGRGRGSKSAAKAPSVPRDTVSALRAEGRELGRLPECAGLARSGYYYALSHPARPTRPEPRGAVAEIFSRTANGCGHRQVAMCLRAELGARVADKTVLKMMREMGVRCGMRRETGCRRCNSHRGVVGETFGNAIGRGFSAGAPWLKMGTDVTEFKRPRGKACFAPVHDFGSKEIVAWSTSTRPDMAQQAELLDRLLERMPGGATPVLHSDMGWQYQHAAWCGRLRAAGITQSMSGKGNCIDNGATEQVSGTSRTSSSGEGRGRTSSPSRRAWTPMSPIGTRGGARLN